VHAGQQSADKSPKRPAIFQFQQVRGRGDAEILRLADLQHGHVLRSQLREAGIGRGALAHRLKTGWLAQAHPSVYRLGGSRQDRPGRMMAAALFGGGDALVSDLDAGSLWEMLDSTQQPSERAPIQVLFAGRNSGPRPGLQIRRTNSLARQDVRWRHGIPLTSPARTILDLAGSLTELELEAVLSIALARNLVRRSQLDDVIARNPYAKGIARLRGLIERPESLQDTRSKYERRFRRLLKAAELPLPTGNIWIAGKFVDGVWPDLKLVLEIDGFKDHGERGMFESDRVRDQHLTIAQHRVMRVTARQIDHAPYALAARTASIITTLRLTAADSDPSSARRQEAGTSEC
jgi:very-short-patch-repair endonuclease